MNYQNYLIDAVEAVLTWDLPEAAFSGAVKDQACLMARINPEEIMWACAD
jgi:hypothetical protein